MRLSNVLPCLGLLGGAVRAEEQEHGDMDAAAAGNYSAGSLVRLPAFASVANDDEGGCTAKSFSQLKSMIKSCAGKTITVTSFKVPPGGQIKFDGIKKKTTVKFTGKVEFEPLKGRSADQVLILVSDCSGLTIKGVGDHHIHGRGEAFWDTHGGNGGGKKPKFMRITKSNNIELDGLRIINTPVHSFSIQGSSKIMIRNIFLNNKEGDKPCGKSKRRRNWGSMFSKRREAGGGGGEKACGHNTDGFGISRSKQVTIRDSIIHNQDDCLAVNSGSDIMFLNNYCEGGHGISVGSIKSGQTVDGVSVINCTIARSENGVRIKTYDDAKNAFVRSIKYKDITLKGIQKYGIVVQQDYRNGGPTGKAGSNVPIKHVLFANIEGHMVGSKHNKVYVLCGSNTCTGWEWRNIKIAGSGSLLRSPACKNAAKGIQGSNVCGGGGGKEE